MSHRDDASSRIASHILLQQPLKLTHIQKET